MMSLSNRDQINKLHREGYVRNRDKRVQGSAKYRNENLQLVRQSYMNWERNNPHKKRADMIAFRLVPLKPNCEICGGIERLGRHHKDYGKPLEVLTLCKVCHEALEVAEPPIYTKQPEIRFYKGFEPVEVLDMPKGHRGQQWPCKVIATGELKNIVVGALCYIPHKIKKTKETMEKQP
jgi:hypothetical protein